MSVDGSELGVLKYNKKGVTVSEKVGTRGRKETEELQKRRGEPKVLV